MTEQKLEFPYEMREMEPHEKEELANLFIDKKDPCEYLRVGPKGYFVYKNYINMASDIYNMDLKPTDIIVASFLRSGTTLMQELVWLMINDADFETAKSVPLIKRYQFIEYDDHSKPQLEPQGRKRPDLLWIKLNCILNLVGRGTNQEWKKYAMFFNETMQELFINVSKDKEEAKKVMTAMAQPALEIFNNLPEPRFAKTHLPMSLLPPYILDKSKVVYVARDPRDVVVSSYYHSILFREPFGFKCDFKQFWNTYRHDLFTLTPHFEHIKEAWAFRNHPNMLFLFYEDIISDMSAAIRRVADFYDKKLTEEQIAAMCDHLSFENFKNNPAVNFEDVRPIGVIAENESFIRKGKVGGWRDYFVGEMKEELQNWIDKNLQNSDLRFPSMNYN